jgi:hypothetical protein
VCGLESHDHFKIASTDKGNAGPRQVDIHIAPSALSAGDQKKVLDAEHKTAMAIE